RPGRQGGGRGRAGQAWGGPWRSWPRRASRGPARAWSWGGGAQGAGAACAGGRGVGARERRRHGRTVPRRWRARAARWGATARARPLAEDLQDQAGAVDHLALPGAFQIALLDRRERRIDERQVDRLSLDQGLEGLDGAAADQCGRRVAAETHDLGMGDREVDG